MAALRVVVARYDLRGGGLGRVVGGEVFGGGEGGRVEDGCDVFPGGGWGVGVGEGDVVCAVYG